jgi:DNA end-binding protein Ku
VAVAIFQFVSGPSLEMSNGFRIVDPQEYFDEIHDVKVTKDMLDLARRIVEQKSGSFEPNKFEDQ